MWNLPVPATGCWRRKFAILAPRFTNFEPNPALRIAPSPRLSLAIVVNPQPRGPVALHAFAAELQAEFAAGHRRAADIGMAKDHTPQVPTASLRTARSVAERDDGHAGRELVSAIGITWAHRSACRFS